MSLPWRVRCTAWAWTLVSTRRSRYRATRACGRRRLHVRATMASECRSGLVSGAAAAGTAARCAMTSEMSSLERRVKWSVGRAGLGAGAGVRALGESEPPAPPSRSSSSALTGSGVPLPSPAPPSDELGAGEGVDESERLMRLVLVLADARSSPSAAAARAPPPLGSAARALPLRRAPAAAAAPPPPPAATTTAEDLRAACAPCAREVEARGAGAARADEAPDPLAAGPAAAVEADGSGAVERPLMRAEERVLGITRWARRRAEGG